MGVLQGLLDLLFPVKCLACENQVQGKVPLCHSCAEKQQNPIAIILPLTHPAKLCCWAPHRYEGIYQKRLQQFKFHGHTGNGVRLAAFMHAALVSAGTTSFDAVCFVPMHPKAQSQRGYNQSELLAKALASTLGCPLLSLLHKRRENQRQHHLPRPARMENVKGIFAASPASAGKRLLLVDDICTTGATMCACAEALYAAGSVAVTGICAAST